MEIQKFNWPLWSGLLLSVFALVSYPFVFVRWPVTRDFPWANFLLFAVAAVLLLVGVRRAFAAAGRRRSKIVGSIVATLSVLVLALFVFSFFIASEWLPASPAAPRVGQKAPDFSLADTSGQAVSLSQLLSAPLDGKAGTPRPRGVL